MKIGRRGGEEEREKEEERQQEEEEEEEVAPISNLRAHPSGLPAFCRGPHLGRTFPSVCLFLWLLLQKVRHPVKEWSLPRC